MDSRKCQTATASPAKPGVLPVGIDSLRVNLDGAFDTDLVLQFSIGFDDGGVEVPGSIDLDLLDNVDAVIGAVAGGDFRHGRYTHKTLESALYGHHYGHQAR